MNAATPIPWSESGIRSAGSGFRSLFEYAPVPAARCNAQGIILETNPALDQMLARSHSRSNSQRLSDLVPNQDHETVESLLHDLLTGTRQGASLTGKTFGPGQAANHWTAWRVSPAASEPTSLLVVAGQYTDEAARAQDASPQAERWEAVGRLAGGVVHDFNNLLTGVMLYCDLLLSSLEQRDRRLRSYAEEIRSAVAQAAGLVRQLLAFSRPKPIEVRPLCLNQVAQAMHDLVTRLIGENITLEVRLDPKLDLVQIDAVQAQQILLNLILNARDAMPNGGHIIVETSNCKFQPVAGSAPSRGGSFPCVMLAIGDNGTGMDAQTRLRLFEPFFTTKHSGKGTGLGLTTVRSIVTANRGLIHVESEPGRGTRVMILLPGTTADDILPPTISNFDSTHPPFQKVKKESLL